MARTLNARRGAGIGADGLGRGLGSISLRQLVCAALLVLFSACALSDPAIDAGLAWLSNTADEDGGYRSVNDLGTGLQSTAEALTAIQVLAPESVADLDATLATLRTADLGTTEGLARGIIAATEGGLAAEADLARLLERQNPDGGFGFAPLHPSTALDTAFALSALVARGQSRPLAAASAVGYLSASQHPAGHWGGPDGMPSLSVTAVATRALWSARGSYPVETALAAAEGWLLARLDTGDLGESFEVALALLAILPRQFDTRAVSSTLDGLRAAQGPDGSWGQDVYTTALALRVLDLAARPAPNPDLAILAGRVLDADTGLGLTGVELALAGTTDVVVTSDAAGRFRFEALEPGDYHLALGPIDYAPLATDIRLGAGAVVDLGNLSLLRSSDAETAVLRGRVIDAETGLPLAGAAVTSETGASAICDADGRYQIAGLIPGAMTITVMADGYQASFTEVELSAGGLFVHAPALWLVGVEPPPTGPARVAGVVLDATSNLPLAGVAIQVATDTETWTLESDAQGRFVIDAVTADRLTLDLELADFIPSTRYLELILGRDQDIGQVRLRPEGVVELLPDPVIVSIDTSARVTDPQTLALSGALGVEIANQGAAALTQDLTLVAYHDADADGVFDADHDLLLGEGLLRGGLAIGVSAQTQVALTGMLPFRDAPIALRVDPAETVPEVDESNNGADTGGACRTLTGPLAGVDLIERWQWSGIPEVPDLADVVQVVNTVLVGQLSDDNNDGVIDTGDIPDLVFAAGDASSNANQTLLVALSGDDGHLLWYRDDLEVTHRGTGALGDIDGDGLPEVVVSDIHRRWLIALEHDGTTKWVQPSGPAVSFDVADGLVIADLDADGAPEIVQGRRVYDHQGNLRWIGEYDRGAGGHRRPATWGLVPIAADVDLDGHSEVIAGRTLYGADGTTRWHRDDIPRDGFNAVGNLDSDDAAEIVLVSQGLLYVLEHTGETLWGPVAIPGSGDRGGAPTVGDFDNDALPEIGVAGSTRYSVFDTDGSLLWSNPTEDSSSAGTGSSLFDFDDDGEVEVLYADERWFRVYDGATGNTLVEVRNGSTTATEYPIVANVDGQSGAEIIVPANWNGPFLGVRVFGPSAGRWADTRGLWNQHSYHVTNIADDGSIPAEEQPSWLTHNTYRLNRYMDRDPLALADLSVGPLALVDQGTGEPLALSVRVGNGGAAAPLEPARVSFYQGDGAAGGTELGSLDLPALTPGTSADLTLSDVQFGGSGQIQALVDPAGGVLECDEGNNSLAIPYASAPPRGRIALGGGTLSVEPPAPVSLTVTLTNTGSFPNDYQAVVRIEDSDGAMVDTLAPRTIEDLASGASRELALSWDTSGLLVGAYRATALLLDLDGNQLDASAEGIAITVASPPGPVLDLRIATDRASYGPGETITLSGLIESLSPNQVLDGLTLELRVVAPDGSLLYEDNRPLAELMPGGSESLAVSELSSSIQGEYRLIARVLDAAGEAVTTDELRFTVIETPTWALDATLSASARTLTAGESLLCTAALHHTGSAPLSALTVRQLLLDLTTAAEGPLQDESKTIDLAPGGEHTWVRQVDTAGLAAGDHACVLQVQVDAAWETLAHAVVAIQRAPVPPIDARLVLGSETRLLALLDPPADHHCDHRRGHDDDRHRGGHAHRGDGDTCCQGWHPDHDGDNHESPVGGAQRLGARAHCGQDRDDAHADDGHHHPCTDPEADRLAALLDGAGVRYELVRGSDTFARALASGAFGRVLLQSATVKLPERVQDLLSASIHRGAGLIVAGDHDSRNGRLDAVLGISRQGKSVEAEGILLADPHGNEPLAFAEPQRVQRPRVADAEVLAHFITARRGGQDVAAITTRGEGDGRADYLAFDLLAEVLAETSASGIADPGAPFADLLLDLVDSAGTSPLRVEPGAVIPVEIQLQAQRPHPGIEVRLSLPTGIELIDPGTGVADSDTLRWTLDLPEGDPVTLGAWLRLPQDQTPLILTAMVVDATESVPLTLSLDLTPLRPPGLDAALTAMAGERAFKCARGRLQRAADHLATADPDRALTDLLAAFGALRAHPHPDAERIRRWVGQAIAETARAVYATETQAPRSAR